MFEALAGLLGIASLLLRHWLRPRNNEEKRDYESDKARFNQALVDSNSDQLSRLFNELRDPALGADGERDPGRPDDSPPR